MAINDADDLIVVSWDGNNINDGASYRCGMRTSDQWGLPDVDPEMVERDGGWPILGGVSRSDQDIQLALGIVGDPVRTLRDQLLQWFDPKDETSKRLIIQDEDGANDRYVYAICRSISPTRRRRSQRIFVIDLVIDGDVRWRADTESDDTWNITASGQTNVISNGGTEEAYPTFEITPTTVKSGGLAYKQFVPVTWRTPYSATKRPVRLGALDTATLTPAKMQADGDDLRIYVDGAEVDRWLVDMDTASTYIWINVDFQPEANAVLQVGIAASGSISSIAVGEDVYDMPESGIVLIDDEVFTYTGRDTFEEELTGITRAAKGSSMGAHSASAVVYWIQHEVIIAYGNVSLIAPTTDDDYEPAFSTAAADSSNTQWKYTVFGDPNGKRTGRWEPNGNVTLSGNGAHYTATQRTLASGDYTVIGAWADNNHAPSYGWSLYDPCGIVNADWADGYKRAEDKDWFIVHLSYWIRGDHFWQTQATLSHPSLDDTWQAWSQAAGAAWSEANKLGMRLVMFASDVEVGTVTVTLSSTDTPTVNMSACAEQGNYPLGCVIENQTTGESISLAFDMELDETLIVNTKDETVIYDADDTNQFQSIDWSSVRFDWLKLQVGDNTLSFTDVGTAAVTIVTKFRARYY